MDALLAAGVRADAIDAVLVEGLSADAWRVRAGAAKAMARQGGAVPPAVSRLVACVRDRRWQVREAAIEALAETSERPDGYVCLLRRALSDSAWNVRVAAAEALGELGPEARCAVADLTACEDDAQWPVREAAERARARIERETVRPLETAVAESVIEIRRRMGEGVDTTVVDGFLVCARDPGLDRNRWKAAIDVLQDSITAQRRELYGTNRPALPAMAIFCDGAESLRRSIAAWSSRPSYDRGCYDDMKRILFIRADSGDAEIRHEVSHLLMDADFGFADGSWFTGGKGFPAWLNEGVAGLWEGPLAYGVGDGEGTDLRHQVLLAALKRIGKFDGAVPSQNLPRDLPPMTIEWLLSLSDPDFYRLYVDGGGLSMALAREWVLYMNERGKLREFYTAFKRTMGEYPTRRRRSWNSGRVVRETLERVMGVRVNEMDADFLRWTTTRTEREVRPGLPVPSS